MAAVARLVLLSLKHAWDQVDDLGERMVAWADLIGEVLVAPHGLQALATVMRHVLETGGPVALERLSRRLVPLVGRKAEEAMMTAAQALREEGQQKGQQDILTRLLKVRFGDLPPSATARIQAADAESLGIWAERVLVAVRLEDVFSAG